MHRALKGSADPLNAHRRASLGSPGPRLAQLLAVLIADEVATIDEPHIVLICDPYEAELSAYGPFDDALAAAAVAEELRTEMLDDEHSCAVDAVVIPLRLFEGSAG
ncbi:MAG: hypothetical protein JWL72_3305 [Ilumatobacteraceae bacterium]|nr:hypothetical protein [Ilumatobacteraceae bacterium]MCU1389967.1 hypothetical protein [Ilumatobacteraceae bacterium]